MKLKAWNLLNDSLTWIWWIVLWYGSGYISLIVIIPDYVNFITQVNIDCLLPWWWMWGNRTLSKAVEGLWVNTHLPHHLLWKTPRCNVMCPGPNHKKTLSTADQDSNSFSSLCWSMIGWLIFMHYAHRQQSTHTHHARGNKIHSLYTKGRHGHAYSPAELLEYYIYWWLFQEVHIKKRTFPSDNGFKIFIYLPSWKTPRCNMGQITRRLSILLIKIVTHSNYREERFSSAGIL